LFILLLGGDKQFANQLCCLFAQYLDNGYTYQDIKTEILTSFYKNRVFRWGIFNNPKKDVNNKNILKNGTRYYHRELKLVSKPPTVERNIDLGTMVSRTPEYFLEPTASYTVQDFVRYFYNTMPIDSQAWHMNKMIGMLKYKIEQYGIDKLLFMTDIAAQDHKANGTVFNLGNWDDYSFIADQRIIEIKSAFSEDQPYYTPKQRKLFNGT
jgi:hypothetical protein